MTKMTSTDRIAFAVDALREQLPAEFAMRGFPGAPCRIAPHPFKHFESEGTVQIVVEVKRGEQWLDLGRDTAVNILKEVVR